MTLTDWFTLFKENGSFRFAVLGMLISIVVILLTIFWFIKFMKYHNSNPDPFSIDYEKLTLNNLWQTSYPLEEIDYISIYRRRYRSIANPQYVMRVYLKNGKKGIPYMVGKDSNDLELQMNKIKKYNIPINFDPR